MVSTISKQDVWNYLKEIPDPEIPVINIVELGVARDVSIADDKVVVTITPTYSGCPAMKAIEDDILRTLNEKGLDNVEIKMIYSPVWTTDWLNDEAKEKLRIYGIAPPGKASLHVKAIACPRCRSNNTSLISQFGSTACKALYRCNDCREPFDYFKCH